MEFKHYLKVVFRNWKLVLPAVLILGSLSTYWTARQPFVYESTASFVVRPRLVGSADAVKAIDTLIRGAEINSTFAKIAESRVVTDATQGALGIDADDEGLTLGATVVAGTNVLTVTVRGPDPELVHSYAATAAGMTVAYIDSLNDVFTLSILDQPTLPDDPSGPNKSLNTVLGLLLALVFGSVVAVLAEYLREPPHVGRTLNVIDPITDTYNDEFFRLRFEEELARARRSGRVFTLAMLKVGVKRAGTPAGELLRHVAAMISPRLRTEDMLAHIGDSTFAVILPDLDEVAADRVLTRWEEELWPGSQGVTADDEAFTISVGIGQYGGDELDSGPSLRAL